MAERQRPANFSAAFVGASLEPARKPVMVEPLYIEGGERFVPFRPNFGSLSGRTASAQRLLRTVRTGLQIDLLRLSLKERDEFVDSGTPLGREAARQYRLDIAVKTLGAAPVDEDHLRRVFRSAAERVIAENFPRDWNGDPILAPYLFGITIPQAWATADKYGIQDGKPKSLDEVGENMGIDPVTVGREVIETIRKLRHGEIVTVIPREEDGISLK